MLRWPNPLAAPSRIRLRERFWTPVCLGGNEKQYSCGVKAILNNVVVCRAIPAPLAGRDRIDAHIDRAVQKCRACVVHWGLYQRVLLDNQGKGVAGLSRISKLAVAFSSKAAERQGQDMTLLKLIKCISRSHRKGISL